MARVSGASDDDLALALALADIADEITLARFRADDLAVETKPDLTPVTEADRAVEQRLRERLAVARRATRWSARNTGRRRHRLSALDRRSDDGTKNYVRGVPVWATLLALQDGDDLTVGVVSAPRCTVAVGAARRGRVPRRRLAGRSAADPRLRRPGLADAHFIFAGLETGPARGGPSSCSSSEPAAGARAATATSGPTCSSRGRRRDRDRHERLAVDLAAPQILVEEAGGRFSDFSGVRGPTAAAASPPTAWSTRPCSRSSTADAHSTRARRDAGMPDAGSQIGNPSSRLRQMWRDRHT